jgi:hypothetical protein
MLSKAPEDRPGGPAAAWAALEPVLSQALGPDWRDDARLPVRIPGPADPPSGSALLPPAYRLSIIPQPSAELAAVPPRPAQPPAGAVQPPPPRPPRRRVGRGALALGGLAVLAAVAVAAVVLLTGRGGGSETTARPPPPPTTTATPAPPPPATLTPEQYRRRGNEICARQPPIEDLFGAIRDPADIRPVVLLALNSSVRPALAQLSALDPPPALRATHERALMLTRQEVTLLQHLADDIAAGADPAAAARAALGRLDRMERQVDAAFRSLGLDQCAGPQRRSPLPPSS